MATPRIEDLRSLVAAIGAQQIEYHRFFPPFADRLEVEFGNYLGSRESVALCNANGAFDFESGSYMHEGLGFEDGRYRIPLMIRLSNLHDDGALDLRIRIYFTREGDRLVAQIIGEPTIDVSATEFDAINGYIYRHLCELFSNSKWFKLDKADYQGTRVGFV
jgi:hypothetical protein